MPEQTITFQNLSLSQATEFRAFWGERSEMRRFKDGSIHEAVLWAASGGTAARRQVVQALVAHTLDRWAYIDNLIFLSKTLFSFLNF